MRSLSVQVQPHKSPNLNINSLTLAFKQLTERHDIVSSYAFDNGDDAGPYYNYTFTTSRATSLWQAIKSDVYSKSEFREHMSKASMAMLSSDAGWENYSMLFHWDPAVKIDIPPAL